MSVPRKGSQFPSRSVVLPYQASRGPEAVALYNASGRTAMQWQELLSSDMMAVNDDGLWTHTKYGYSVPRRNGKNEVVTMRELWGLEHGEQMLHTAHRVTTSSSAARRLAARLDGAGYTEVIRVKKDEPHDKQYTFKKQQGQEIITVLGDNGGSCSFRTRSSTGGLGEGFDLLVIDEAQEYKDSDESALKYVVSDSKNPQTVFLGTPPTAVSTGTVFLHMREKALRGEASNTGWAEWSVDKQTSPKDKEAWYATNPSLGTILTERKIADEIGDDVVDFNIQRLGLWLRYKQKSAISPGEWQLLQCDKLPKLKGKLFVGIKYGHDGAGVAMSIAVRTADGRILVETIGYHSVKEGNNWILQFLSAADVAAVAVDGANGQELLSQNMAAEKLKKPLLPTVKDIITANATFTAEGLGDKHLLCHMGQPSLTQVVTNCEKRAIGSGGGFGYRSILDGAAIELMDSMILAFWLCYSTPEKPKKQKIRY